MAPNIKIFNNFSMWTRHNFPFFTSTPFPSELRDTFLCIIKLKGQKPPESDGDSSKEK